MDDKLNWYRAKVEHVVDGETLDILFDMGMNVFVRKRVALHGIKTPRIYGTKKESEEFQKGMEAKAFVEERLPPNKTVWTQVFEDKEHDASYTVIVFFQDDGGKHVNIGQLLLEDGLAEESVG